MAHDITKELKDFFVSKIKTFSQAEEYFPTKPGLRIIAISGDLARVACNDSNLNRIFSDLLTQIPSDAMIIDDDGQVIRHRVAYSHTGYGAYNDELQIIIASNEWQPIDEGSMIPFLEIKRRVTREEFERLHSGTPE